MQWQYQSVVEPVLPYPEGWRGYQPERTLRAKALFSGVFVFAPVFFAPEGWQGNQPQAAPRARSPLHSVLVCPLPWEITPDRWQSESVGPQGRRSAVFSAEFGPVYVVPAPPYDPAVLDWMGSWPTKLRYRPAFQAESFFVTLEDVAAVSVPPPHKPRGSGRVVQPQGSGRTTQPSGSGREW